MNVPLQKTQQSSSLEDEIDRALRAGLAAAHPPPASSEAGPATGLWGPTPQRTISPIALLAQVADNTERLQEQMEALCREVTGEQAPPKRLQPLPIKAGGLLPAIAQIATNIEQAHIELERLILHVRRRL